MRIKELRYWVQKVLPLVYDDSLSYMELLNKVVAKLNEVIELANGIDATITEEVNGIMNGWIEDGTFEDIINQTVLANLNDRITAAEGDIDTLEGNVESLDNRVDALEERPTSIVTPQSLGYPSTKTADEVFEILEGYSATQIAIPSGDYNLTRTYNLQNVIIDDGNYPNFAPIFKRKKYVDLQSFSVNKNVQLPATQCYIEALCKLGDYYYAAVYNYTQTTDLLIKYDANFNQLLQANMTRPEQDEYSYHAPRNIYTDGTYIYVDFTSIVHKYNASTLSLLDSWTGLSCHSTYYFNGEFWGITWSGTTLVFYELNNDFTIKSSHTVDRMVSSEAQSFTMHNGLIYVPTTTGYFTIVDMSDWSFENLSYENQVEIENILFVDNKPCFTGHPVGGGGNGFWFGEFNGGQAVKYFGQYFFDGDKDYWNLNAANKFGVYDFENYDISTFGNSGKMIILGDIIYAKVDRYLFVKTPSGGWRLVGTDGTISIPVASYAKYVIHPNGSVHLHFEGYTATANDTTTITFDSSNIWSLLAYGDSTIRDDIILAKNPSGLNLTGGVAAAFVRVGKTSITIRTANLIGTLANVDLYGDIELYPN